MNKYIRAVSSNYIFFSINTIFFLIITAVAIRIMGEELYGLWAILNAVLLFSGIGMLGMGAVVNKFASEDGENALPANSIISAAILILLPMAILVMALIIVGRNWIAAQFGLAPQEEIQFSLALTFTALSIVPQFLGRIPHGYLLSQLKNNQARAVESGITILMWTGAVTIASVKNNLVWMALWGLGTQIIGMCILFAMVVPMIKFQWRLERQTLRRMLSFSGFSFIENLAMALFQQFDRILVGLVLGPAAAGVYSVGTSVALRLSIIAGQATEVLLPYASKKNSTNQQAALYTTFRQASQIIGLFLGLLTSLLIIWMDIILRLWISSKYALNYAGIFRILLLAYLIISISRLGHQTMTGMGNIKTSALVYSSSSFIMLASLCFLSARYGLSGAAYANLAMILLLTLNLLIYHQFERDKLLQSAVKDLGIAFLLPILAYIFCIFPQYVNPIGQGVASIVLVSLSIISASKNGALCFVQASIANSLNFRKKP